MLARLSRWTLPTLILLAALAIYRLVLVDTASDAIDLPRNQPWLINPRHDEPRMVTDDQLHAILDRLKPSTESFSTNDWVHALRLWGPHAEFDDPRSPSGRQMLDFFLDDSVYRHFAGSKTPPLFVIGREGVSARAYEEDYAHRTTSSYHQDDLLATLAESGVPLDTPLITRDGESRVADLLTSSLRRFHPEQYEYEWSIISYARYAFPLETWRNKYGQRIDAQSLVTRLIDAPLPVGPCNGLHRLEAIALLYRVDEEAGGVLRPATRQRLLAQMRRVSGLLVQSQNSRGYWTRSWPRGPEAAEDKGHDMGERILVTGHHLEWLALAPREVLPPRENLVRAGQWLARTMLEIDTPVLRKRYGPFSHAARALSLWRGKQPYDAWRHDDVISAADVNPADPAD